MIGIPVCVRAHVCVFFFSIIPGVIPGRILLPVTVASAATVPLGKHHAKLDVHSLIAMIL